MHLRRNVWLAMSLAALGLAACGGDDDGDDTGTQPVATEAAPAPTDAPTDTTAAPAATEAAPEGTEAAGAGGSLVIAVNPWTGSAANANVAATVLTNELGLEVELVDIDEFAQFPALGAGELDATLEVWPSGHVEDYATYIEGGGGVADGGELGVIGKIGWYIPTFLLADHPELATWEGLNDNAALFATAETGDKGQFLAGDPSFVSYDEEIVENLGLNFQVVYAGSEAALLTAIETSIANEEPLLLYFYKPHWAFLQYDLTEVELPAVTDACAEAAAAGGDGYACDYPEDVLYKAFNEGLADRLPEAHEFLTNMNYANDQQEAIAYLVDVEGMDPADAAQQWVDENPDVWQAWLPA